MNYTWVCLRCRTFYEVIGYSKECVKCGGYVKEVSTSEADELSQQWLAVSWFQRNKQRLLNVCYLVGTVIFSFSSIFQIVKTVQTQSVEDIAVMWLALLVVGTLLHAPRALMSSYWVWKLNMALALGFIGTLLGLVIAYK